MPSTIERVIGIVSEQSGVSSHRLSAASAIAQDIGISGDDVDELVARLSHEFGQEIGGWPWGRYANLSEPHLFTAFSLVWRLITWPVRGRLLDAPRYERLELGHIAKAIDAGHWLEP